MRRLLVEARIECVTAAFGEFVTFSNESFYLLRDMVLDGIRVVIVKGVVSNAYDTVASPVEVRDNF